MNLRPTSPIVDMLYQNMQKNDLFYFSPLVELAVDNTLFRVPRESFEQSGAFTALFNRSHASGAHDPLVALEGINAFEFTAFLKLLFRTPVGSNKDYELSEVELESALKLASLWKFEGVRKSAVSRFEAQALTVNPSRAIQLAHLYGIDHWIIPAVERLSLRPESLTIEEASQIGVETVIEICANRDMAARLTLELSNAQLSGEIAAQVHSRISENVKAHREERAQAGSHAHEPSYSTAEGIPVNLLDGRASESVSSEDIDTSDVSEHFVRVDTDDSDTDDTIASEAESEDVVLKLVAEESRKRAEEEIALARAQAKAEAESEKRRQEERLAEARRLKEEEEEKAMLAQEREEKEKLRLEEEAAERQRLADEEVAAFLAEEERRRAHNEKIKVEAAERQRLAVEAAAKVKAERQGAQVQEAFKKAVDAKAKAEADVQKFEELVRETRMELGIARNAVGASDPESKRGKSKRRRVKAAESTLQTVEGGLSRAQAALHQAKQALLQAERNRRENAACSSSSIL